MDEIEDIVEALGKLMKAKSVSAAKLANMTDVPVRFIEAILAGEFDTLPSQPYIRGYLFKISNALGAESDHLWHVFQSSVESLSSGEKDKLPANRFALQRMNRTTLMWIFAGLLVLLLLVSNWNRILGRPNIDILVPETTEESVITVSGMLNPDDRLTLNGEIIYTNDAGSFEKQVQLEPRLNTLDFRAKRYLGRETKVIKQVFYQEPIVETENADSQEEN